MDNSGIINLPLDRVIAFHPILAEVFEGIPETIYFQQLYYWSNKGERKDGYIYKTKQEIQEETHLTIKQQDRIRNKLETQNFIKTKKIKVNGSPTIHYKINVENVQKAIDKAIIPNVTKGNIPTCPKVTLEHDKRSYSTIYRDYYIDDYIDNTNVAVETADKSILLKEKTIEQQINTLIPEFKPVNPMYSSFYKNKTQRKALGDLIKHIGYEETLLIIKTLPDIIYQPYAPKVTTPLDLKTNMGRITAFVRQQHNTKKGGVFDAREL